MERSLITWNIPNVITIWMMLFLLGVFFAVASQALLRAMPQSAAANNSGGY